MSGNNAYVKSMNGIVSFDSGGTTIEGGNITSNKIDCTTLNATTVNATSKVNTSTTFTDFIAPYANVDIAISGDAKFNGDIYVDNIYARTGSLTTLKNDTTVNGLLTSNTLSTEQIEGRNTSSYTKQLKIGQYNDLTTSINIGRKEQIVLGTVYPAIPPRTTFYAVGDDDIANKKYVDSVVTGTNILSLTNIFTGASNTFNNFIKTSQIDSVTPSSTYSFLTSHTSTINIGTASSAITLGSSTAPVRTDYVPLANADICNKLYVDSTVSSGSSGLLSSTNIWTGASNTFNNAIRCAIAPSAATDLCNKTYVDSVAGSLLLTATNVWTGASNTFNNIVNFGVSTAPQLKIYSNRIESTNGSDTISFGSNTTGGNIEIGKTLTSGSIILANNFRFIINAGNNTLNFRTLAVGDNFSLCSNLTTGNINIGESQTTGDINIGGGARTSAGQINIGNGAGTNQNPINIGSGNSNITIFGKLLLSASQIRLFGYTSYVIHNGANGNYTITNANIDIDFYIVMIGTVNCSLLLNATIPGQRVYIRNAMGAGNFNNVITPAGTNIIRAGGGITSFLTMTENTGIMFLCDGATWIVMMAYP